MYQELSLKTSSAVTCTSAVKFSKRPITEELARPALVSAFIEQKAERAALALTVESSCESAGCRVSALGRRTRVCVVFIHSVTANSRHE